MIIAAYTLIDNQGVSVVHPLVYIYLMYALSTAGVLVTFIGRQPDWTSLRRLASWGQAAAVACLSIVAYSMVLIALNHGADALRRGGQELSIVIGAALGVLLLGEPLRRERIGGALLIAAGVAIIGVA